MPWICNTSCKVLKYCIIKKCKFATLRLKKSHLWGDMFSSAFMFCCTHSVKRPVKVPDFQTHEMSETLNVVPTWYVISLVTHPVLDSNIFCIRTCKNECCLNCIEFLCIEWNFPSQNNEFAFRGECLSLNCKIYVFLFFRLTFRLRMPLAATTNVLQFSSTSSCQSDLTSPLSGKHKGWWL